MCSSNTELTSSSSPRSSTFVNPRCFIDACRDRLRAAVAPPATTSRASGRRCCTCENASSSTSSPLRSESAPTNATVGGACSGGNGSARNLSRSTPLWMTSIFEGSVPSTTSSSRTAPDTATTRSESNPTYRAMSFAGKTSSRLGFAPINSRAYQMCGSRASAAASAPSGITRVLETIASIPSSSAMRTSRSTRSANRCRNRRRALTPTRDLRALGAHSAHHLSGVTSVVTSVSRALSGPFSGSATTGSYPNLRSPVVMSTRTLCAPPGVAECDTNRIRHRPESNGVDLLSRVVVPISRRGRECSRRARGIRPPQPDRGR